MQTGTLSNLLTPSRIARLLDNEAKNGSANAYTLPELFTDLKTGVFPAGRPDAFKRNLQRSYVETLAQLMTKEMDVPPGASSEALANYGFTPINVSLSDIRPLVRAELKSLLTLAKSRSVAGDTLTKAHYDDLVIRINDILYPKK